MENSKMLGKKIATGQQAKTKTVELISDSFYSVWSQLI